MRLFVGFGPNDLALSHQAAAGVGGWSGQICLK